MTQKETDVNFEEWWWDHGRFLNVDLSVKELSKAAFEAARQIVFPPKANRLRYCPFCDGSNLEKAEDFSGTRYEFIRCNDCGARGPLSDSRVKKTWNDRA